MDDYGLQVAEESLGKLEREYKRIYSQAAKEMREKQRKFLKEFEREKAQRLAALDTTEEAEKAYKAWLREQTLRSDWLDDMVDELSRKATTANEAAVATLLDKVPGVYATNANYEAYSIEKALKARTAFTLVDEDTVRNLVTGRGSKAAVAGRLLPEVTFPKVDRPKDYRWNRQKFTSAITQGILQGESIPNIVKRTESIFGSNQAAAYRAARTAVGSAQNSGRYFSMLRAEDMGIIVTKKWIATHDDRTRMSHRMLDGQEVPVKEPFDSEHGPIDYPNDPAADPAETYNCRCSIKEEVGGFEPLAESYENWLEIQGMDYEEWEAVVASGRVVGEHTKSLGATQRYAAPDIGTAPTRPMASDFSSRDELDAARAAYRVDRDEFEARRRALVDDIASQPGHGYGTREEVLAWAENRGVMVSEEIIGTVDSRTMDEIVDVSEHLMSKYPEVLESFGSSGYRYTIALADDSSVFMEASGGLQLNPTYFSDYRSTVDHVVSRYTSASYSEQVGRELTEIVRGDGTFRTSVTHEFGHNVDSAIRGRRFYGSDGVKDFEGLHQYKSELLELTKKHTTSEYSLTNELEAFAEGFAEMECNPTSEYAKAFAKFLRRWR